MAECEPVSGYDLVKIFDLSVAHYWHAHHGQIYPTLARMDRSGWVRQRHVIQHGRPSKRLYTITAAGRAKPREWLEGPFEALKLKHASLLRRRFLAHLGADGAIAKLAEETAAWKEYLARFRAIERDYFDAGNTNRDANSMFSYFTLRRGIDFVEGNIPWCDWAIGEIERNRQLFRTSS
ncbi:MAG: PadR family transcriptional regulator [Candidatus Binataceae bacterium]